MTKLLKDKVAIVTGGARGIGREIVLMLACEGCDVVFNFQKSQDSATVLEKEVKALGVRCQASCVDIRDSAAVKAWIAKSKEAFGRLDILINNAGIVRDKALMLMSDEEWIEVVNTNLDGMFYAARACIVTFLKQRSGDIINISSVSGITGLPRQVNYSATKGGMNAFTKALAKEVSLYGIRVNAVAPGLIRTTITDDMDEKRKQEILKTIPLGRMGEAEEVANCVKFLLSPSAAYVTGQIIAVDGGLTMR